MAVARMVGHVTYLSAQSIGDKFGRRLQFATDVRYTVTEPEFEVADVRLRFEDGRVVASEASRGGDFLRSLLEMDAGAAVIGELAFGLNYEIDRFTRNILFDEKIGGTIHVALGSSFSELGGRNESKLHWVLICDLRADGEVYADGELVWKAGSFLSEPEPAVERV